MESPLQQRSELCYRALLTGLTEQEFLEEYDDSVSDSAEDLCMSCRQWSDGAVTYELANGLTALEEKGKWSLFESEARAKQREHISAWAGFARGAWISKVPQEPGLYFARSLDGKRSIRELKRIRGRLIDTSGGLVTPGTVTNWRGDWWSEPIPALPGSY